MLHQMLLQMVHLLEPPGEYDKLTDKPSINDGSVYNMLLSPASEAEGDEIPNPLSQISPAAVPSKAEAAEDPPSPENTKVPNVI